MSRTTKCTTYNTKQGLQVVVAKQCCMLPNDVTFQKTKNVSIKEGSMIVEIEYTLNFHPLT